MLLAIAIVLGVIWALVVGFVMYDESAPGLFVVGFLIGLVQAAVVIGVVFVAVHFIVKFW